MAAAVAAEGAAGGVTGEGAAPGRAAKRARIYTDHRPMSEITAGLKGGRLHQVIFTCLSLDCHGEPTWLSHVVWLTAMVICVV